MIKNDEICEYCTYKNIPTSFSPCLGCRDGNMDRLAKQSIDKEDSEHILKEQI